MSHTRRFSYLLSSTLLILFTLLTPKLVTTTVEARTSDVPVTDDLIVTQNVTLRPGTYTVTDAEHDGIIQIEADNITLDGTGVIIVGTNASHTGIDSDGFGIKMNGHTGLTLRNFTIRGFRYGVSIEDARAVLIENSNISGNLKNITDPWVWADTGGYGGGILFNRVWQSTVRNDVLTNQSTGLEMNDSHENSIINNKISAGPEGNEAGQVSCWGVRLSGSTANLVRGNIMDYVDRRRYPCHDPGCGDVGSCFGPRPGFLESGDSAGIMLVNRSDRNRIISNSATHGGDGIFIGGTNNYNYVYGNDASYSPHNAVEGTFSEGNIYENNVTSNSCYGFWLGYSSRTRITNNEINDIILEGVAIEHGSDTEIDRNSILRGQSFGIHLWNHSGLEPSRDYNMHHNDISLNQVGIKLEDTSRSAIWRNQISNNREANISLTRNVEGAPDLDISHNNLICQNTTAVSSNLAYQKPATASKSNETAVKAVDGNVIDPASTWNPGAVDQLVSGDYWQVDLGAIKSVSEVILYMENPHDFPDKFKIYVLTTSTPTGGEMPVVNETNRDEKPVSVYDFAPASGRYIRIVSNESRNWVQMAEFAAFTQQGQNPLACHYSIYSSMSNGLDVAALYNWWGKTGEQAIMDSIYDQNDDANLGKVLYNPFVLEPVSAPGIASGPGIGPWTNTTPLPQPSAAPFLDRGQQLIIYNDRVYVFGGQGPNNTRLTNVYFSRIRPDGTLTQWVNTTPLPVAPFDQVVVRVGNRVYLMTGASGASAVYFASINSDGTIGAWTSTASMNITRQSFAAAAYGNYIFVVGGNSGGVGPWVGYASVKSDGTLNPWAFSRPLPEPIQSHAMVIHDGVLYVLAPSARVYYAPINKDGTIGVWKTAASMPEIRSKYSALESNSYLYVLGGTSAPDSERSVRSVAVLNSGALDQWQDIAQRQAIADLPNQINGLRVGAYNGYVYALGGYDNNSLYKNTVYYSQFAVPGGCQGGENLTAPFLSGLDGPVSSLTYAGLSTVTVSGVGQAFGTSFTDAFYVFADGNGNPVTPYRPTAFTLSLNSRKISDFFYALQQVPAYRPDHRYTFRINAPAGPLTFGVVDASPTDNSGQYLVGLCGGTP